MSMAVSLEARVPLLDHVLADYVNASAALVQAQAIGVEAGLPQGHEGHPAGPGPRSRGEAGFEVPMRTWLLGPLRGWCREVLLQSCPQVLDEAGVNRLLAGLEGAQRDFSAHVWRLLALSVWAGKTGGGW